MNCPAQQIVSEALDELFLDGRQVDDDASFKSRVNRNRLA